MFAAILICGLTVSSCKKDPTPEPEPVKQTVLTGMLATGVQVYDSVTYSYEYDADYRIVRSEAHQTNDNQTVLDYRFTYSDGLIKVEGEANGDHVTYECTLDSLNRITRVDQTIIFSDSITSITHFDYTYDADGHLVSSYRISEPEEEGVTTTCVWEGEEMKSSNLADGMMTVDYETSDAPAQALLSLFDYHSSLSDLCAQGCFGKTPAHMPSKRTLTTTLSIPGMNPVVKVFDYTYTTDAEGRLATYEETGTRTVRYTFNWEER